MQRIKNFYKVITSILLSVLFLFIIAFSSCSITIDGRTYFNLSNIEYETFDDTKLVDTLDAAEALSKKLATMTEEDANGATGIAQTTLFISFLNTLTSELNSFANAFVIARITYFKDAADMEMANTYSSLLEKYTSYYNRYLSILGNIVDSPFGTLLSKEDIDFINKKAALSNNEQFVAKQKELNQLANEYIRAYNGKAYNTYTQADALDVAARLIQFAKVANESIAETSYTSYAEYAYAEVFERGFSPQQASVMTSYVKEYLSDLYYMLPNINEQEELIALSSINTKIDRAYSAKKQTVNLLFKDKIKEYANEIGGTMPKAFDYLNACELYQVGDKATSYNGAHTSMLPLYNSPYIYAKLKNNYSDLTTFIHEFGHFNAYYADAPNTSNYDIAEIHSQGNEFLFMDVYEKMGGSTLKKGMLKASLKSNIVYALNMGCLMDELQQYVYENADTLTPQDVCNKQNQLLEEYSLTAKVIGDPSFRYFWAAIPHTFEDPFYYISYAASLIPALELFELSESGHRADAIAAYNYIVSSDEKDYDALFRGAGLGGPFSEAVYPNIRDTLLLRTV